MQNKPVALVTGANQGIGLQLAKDWAAHGYTVLVGPRSFEKGEAAAKSIEGDVHALQLDGTDKGIDRGGRCASPGFTATALNNFAGIDSVEVGARNPLRVALDEDGPTGTFAGPSGVLPW